MPQSTSLNLLKSWQIIKLCQVGNIAQNHSLDSYIYGHCQKVIVK